MNLRRLGTYAAIAFVIWFVIEEPVTAAHVVKGIGGFLDTAAHGISTFFASL